MNSVMKSSLLEEAYGFFHKGFFGDAIETLEKALEIDFEDDRILSALKCANFWREKENRIDTIGENLAKGEYLLKEWKNFMVFAENFTGFDEKCINALRQWCFGTALNSYEKVFYDSGGNDHEILFKIGRCYKCMGDYANALTFLERTFRQQKENAAVMAELADCYALINEIKPAKLFFREAFFIDPSKVETAFLESMMIQRLISRVRELNLSREQIKEWIPVYGVIYGVFNIKRELKPLELGKLKQSIFSFENRLEENGEIGAETQPRLLNAYFRLVDHYISVGEEREKIEELLRKIKRLNNEVFNQYIN